MPRFDTIVIGSGISGLNFALRASERKKRVLIITKKKLAQSSTNFAQGGIAAVLSKLDDFKTHVKDTLIAGCFRNDRRAVRYMVRHGPAAIKRLIELGVPFATQNGELLLTREGGHTKRRIAFVSDYTGQAIERVLVKRAKNTRRITIYEHTFASDLLIKNRTCYGVRIIKNNAVRTIMSDTTVLATGGIGQLYAHTTNPAISTGDGLAMASRAGCTFKDLEFVQFHPTALNLLGAPRFLISEAVRGEGGYLVNQRGERFMRRFDRRLELAPRDVVARAIFEEEKRGPVFLDLRHKNARFVATRFPQIYRTLKEHKIDMGRSLIPVTPAAHYSCGGVRVNLKGETGIKNLFAFGEVACTGVHGANRLASNSLLEALVFSDRILHAQRKASRAFRRNPRFLYPRYRPTNLSEKRLIHSVRSRLKDILWNWVGIVRRKKELACALRELMSLSRALAEVKAYDELLLETKNMVTAGILVTRAALSQKRSVGCHYRID